MIPKKIIQKCRRIKVVITDVDGVLTDGGMYFSEKGEQILSDQITKNMQLIYNTHSVSNIQTLETINYFNTQYNYLADPHTATGLYVLNQISNKNHVISLACAHPAKFGNAIFEAIKKQPSMPDKLKNIFDQNEKMTILDNDANLIRSYILELI